MLESQDDIVLVHYLNIAQRQQAGRSSSRLLSIAANSQHKADDKFSSSSSDIPTSQDCSKSSDMADDATDAPSSRTADAKESIAAPADAADSAPSAPMLTEAHMSLLPSLPSMDMFLVSLDSKLSSERVSAGDDPARGNAAVQELLKCWGEEEQQTGDPALPPHSAWQVCPNTHADLVVGVWVAAGYYVA